MLRVDDILVCETGIQGFNEGELYRVLDFEHADMLVVFVEDCRGNFLELYQYELDNFALVTQQLVELVYDSDFLGNEISEHEEEFLNNLPEDWVLDIHDEINYGLVDLIESTIEEGYSIHELVEDYVENGYDLDAVLDDLPSDDTCELNKEDRITYLRTCIDIALVTEDKEWFLELSEELIEIERK